MNTFKIELTQKNTKGTKTFEAIANAIKVENLENLASEMADFTKDTIKHINGLQKLGVKGLQGAKVKMSQPLSVKITAIEDDVEVSFNIAQFGSFAAKKSQKTIEKVFKLNLEYTNKFAHIWA